MPKVTVITLPNEMLDVPQPKTEKKQAPRHLSFKTILYKGYCMFLPIMQTQNWFINMLSFLLARVTIMGDIAPIGLAFFAAVAQLQKKRAFTVGLWCIAGVLSAGYYVEVGTYVATMLLYYLWSDKITRLHKKIMAVPLLAFCVILCYGFVISLFSQATLYNFLLQIFDASTCLVLSYIFMYGVPMLLEKQSIYSQQYMTSERVSCMILLLAIAVAGLGNIIVFDYNIRNMAGCLLIMAMSLAGGPGLGACVGVVIGLVIGLSDGNATLTVSLYAVAGVLAGAFRGLGKFAVILGFILGSVITILYFGQDQQLLRALSECAIAGGMFFLVPSKGVANWCNLAFSSPTSVSAADNSLHVQETVSKIKNIAEVFHELAGTFGSIVEDTKGKIRDDQLAKTLSTVGEQLCVNCGKRPQCWEADFYRTYHGILELLEQTDIKSMPISNLPKVFQDNCIRKKELIETIGLVTERNITASFWQKRIIEQRQIVTEQMEATSVIISNLAYEIGKVEHSNKALSLVLQEKAAMLECSLTGVRVTGKQGGAVIEASKSPCNNKKECINTILPLASSIMKEKLMLKAECGDTIKKKRCTLAMKVATRFQIETGIASFAKEGQGICGDTCTVIPLYKGKIALILSDGMGSGKKAALESNMAIKFLQRLLSVGFDTTIAVKTVNSMLLLRTPDESFVTLDMAVIDTYSGETEFLKIGAAPSFIKRVREVMTIKSSSLPIGILQQIEIKPLKEIVVEGDFIIMVSDGIVDVPQSSLDKENWLANFLRRGVNTKPQALAEQILAQALLMSGNRVHDDMTVMVAKVAQNTDV
ncbi:stage II sporulation protein E [Pelosinus propionicus]|uniref:Stage II sporulation protein E n=1 Tax=Pelosinus propionicus DSM 13327 TaxID=1123291 RepID=A0A1I4NRP8_9FIRM|nr:stage II sporulation protein E [Pelosinus propionicus]SFM18194.1 stage II sporulation protein E [Pelosinus propionicus DSM 13327]